VKDPGIAPGILCYVSVSPLLTRPEGLLTPIKDRLGWVQQRSSTRSIVALLAHYEGDEMGVATSIVIFAIGAILKFATTVHSTNFNIQTIGVILMVVGAVGFLVSLIFWASWGGFRGWHRNRSVYHRGDGTIVEERHDSMY
jgi:hypothetical protein